MPSQLDWELLGTRQGMHNLKKDRLTVCKALLKIFFGGGGAVGRVGDEFKSIAFLCG